MLGALTPDEHRLTIPSRAARLANFAAVAIDMQLGRIHDELDGGDPDVLWRR